MNHTERDGLLFLLISAAAYAFFAIFAKLAYNAGVAPLDLVTWRFLIAAPVIWLLLWISRRRQPGIRSDKSLPQVARLPRRQLLVMGVLFAVSSITGLLSLSRIPASMYTVLLYSYPAIVALMSLFFGDRLPLRGWLALGLTLIGVVLTVPELFERGAQSASADTLGVIFALLNAVSYSTYIVLSGRLLRGHTALAEASAWSITGSLLSFLAIAAVRGLNPPQTLAGWGTVIGMGLVCSVIATFAFYAGMQRVGAARAAILSMFEPVIVLILSATLLGERMLPVQLLGGAFILGSIVLLQARWDKSKAQSAQIIAEGS
jgi:drug/metabolite transporter (DMT)-like permease